VSYNQFFLFDTWYGCLKYGLIYNYMHGKNTVEFTNNKTIEPMNKAALVEKVHAVLGTTKVQAEQIVDAVFDNIIATLKKGDEVSVAGFGIFSAKTRAARTARNPRTGEMVKVAAMKVAKFRAAKALKDAINK
jgi:DNA-binding protein HU-beta